MPNISLLVQGDLGVRAAELQPTTDDRRRADRFVRPADRARSLVTADLLRQAAAELTGADDVVVTRHCRTCGTDGDHGRPVVRSGLAAGVHLSAAHAGDVVVVVGSTSSPVGVDVELVDLVGFPGFDDVALTPGERATLAPTDLEGRARLWTRKEAVLKWTGLGLAVEPALLEFDSAGRPRSAELDAELPPDLVVVDVDGLLPGCVGSTASVEALRGFRRS